MFSTQRVPPETVPFCFAVWGETKEQELLSGIWSVLQFTVSESSGGTVIILGLRFLYRFFPVSLHRNQTKNTNN